VQSVLPADFSAGANVQKPPNAPLTTVCVNGGFGA
jgi:hypothetical protein